MAWPAVIWANGQHGAALLQNLTLYGYQQQCGRARYLPTHVWPGAGGRRRIEARLMGFLSICAHMRGADVGGSSQRRAGHGGCFSTSRTNLASRKDWHLAARLSRAPPRAGPGADVPHAIDPPTSARCNEHEVGPEHPSPDIGCLPYKAKIRNPAQNDCSPVKRGSPVNCLDRILANNRSVPADQRVKSCDVMIILYLTYFCWRYRDHVRRDAQKV